MLDALVTKFDRAAGLTSFRSRDERILRYFVEALAALKWVPEGGPAIDIGSGGGSPALPLAIARPMVEWVLVESNGRKSLFLEEAVRALGLDKVRVHRGRFEAMESPTRCDLVTCRAVKLELKTQSMILSSLSTKGRFLWFGAEKRLESACRDLSLNTTLRVEGPRPLLGTKRARSRGWLLIAEKRPGTQGNP